MPVEDKGYITTPLMSVAEAADYLGVGRKVIYELIERGSLRVAKVDGSTRIEKRSLDEFIASGEMT